jgi:chromosome segregation ATPase
MSIVTLLQRQSNVTQRQTEAKAARETAQVIQAEAALARARVDKLRLEADSLIGLDHTLSGDELLAREERRAALTAEIEQARLTAREATDRAAAAQKRVNQSSLLIAQSQNDLAAAKLERARLVRDLEQAGQNAGGLETTIGTLRIMLDTLSIAQRDAPPDYAATLNKINAEIRNLVISGQNKLNSLAEMRARLAAFGPEE